MTDKAKVYEVDLDELRPDPSNANKGSERGQYMIDASITKTGLHRGVAVDANGYLVAGNKTHQAAIDAGFKRAIVVETDGDTLVVTKRRDFNLLDDDPNNIARQAAYFDNRSQEVSLTWDAEQLLADMTAGLPLEDFWRQDELDELLAEIMPPPEPVDAGPQIDRADELRQKWGVELGQLWLLDSGKGHPHRLICGDCTDPEVVARVMDGERAQVVFTSPPYWVGFEYEQEDKWGEVVDFIARFCALYVGHVSDDGRIIINTGTVQAGQLTDKKAHMKLLIDTWGNALESNGWLMRYVRFWVKDGGLLHTAPQSDCIDQHTEFMGYFYKPGGKFRGQERTGEPWAGKGYWDDIPGAARQSGHIAAFPLEIPSRNLQLFTRPGESVLEPFAGSGTTLIACEQLARQCRAVELSPAYCAVILQRWADATGYTPVLLEA